MGSRLGRRVIHFANLPIKLLMPTSFTNITEIALKTIPSASKIEIKRVLESLYGFEVDKVRTLNMDGKKKKRGGLLIAKPDYKKAYVTLRNPLSISPDVYPIRIIEEDKRNMNKQSKSSIVEEGEAKRHWLHEKEPVGFKAYKGFSNRDRRRTGSAETVEPSTKFPWSSMRSVFHTLVAALSSVPSRSRVLPSAFSDRAQIVKDESVEENSLFDDEFVRNHDPLVVNLLCPFRIALGIWHSSKRLRVLMSLTDEFVRNHDPLVVNVLNSFRIALKSRSSGREPGQLLPSRP
ncbi:rplW, partial [Cucurbita argyrosperma subsp. argyrosperma]